MCYAAEFGRSKSNGTSVIKEINLKKIDHSVPPFKVTQGRRNRCLSIHHDFLSKCSIATVGLSRTVSEINGDFSRKVQIFLPPFTLRPVGIGYRRKTFILQKYIQELPPMEKRFRKSKIRERWDPIPLRWGVADHQISHGNTYGERGCC